MTSSLEMPVQMGSAMKGLVERHSAERGSCPAMSPVSTLVIASCLVWGATSAWGYSKTESYVYEDNSQIWVIGQVKRVVCVSSTEPGCSNTEVASATYDPATATQLTFRSFGKLAQTLTYNADGTVATVKDGNEQVTRLSAWYRGVPRTVTYPDATVDSAEVSDLGWIRSVTDENGFKTCYSYDLMGRVRYVTFPSETQLRTCDTSSWTQIKRDFVQVASAEYGVAANHWRLTEQNGNGYKISYFDGQWRPVLVYEYDAAALNSTKRFQRFSYDHEGRTTFESYHGVTDSLAAGKRTSYDSLGRISRQEADSELGVLATQTEYLSGFRTRVTDPRGYATTTHYLAYSEPKTESIIAIVHPEGAYTDFTRDAYGKALAITRRDSAASLSATRTYTYNSNNELCRSVEPESGATLFGYDGAGNLKWTAAGLSAGQACDSAGTAAAVAARRVDRTYDSRNRLKTFTFPDGMGNQSWSYTLDGRPASVSVVNPKVSGDTVTTYEYFRRGLSKSERVTIQGGTYTSSWDYNARGDLVSQTYPSGLNVTLAPNALGQPTQAGSFATGVTYYPNGAIKTFSYGNGVVHTLLQNARELPSRSTDCRVAGTCAVADMRLDLSYTYDAGGNVASIVDGLYARQNRAMTYDGLGRLRSVASTMFGNASYSYNILDDLTQIAVGGGSQARTQSLCYDSARRLTSIRTGSCSGAVVRALGYDVRGNLSSQAGQSYIFDFGNRLREAVGKEWYAYDGHGHRVISCETSDCATFVYTSKGQLLYTYDVRNNKQVDHVYLGASLVALRERTIGSGGETVKYQHTDALGTPIAVTNSTMAFVSKHEYEPFGLLVNGAVQDGPSYTGHMEDAATALVYMRQRYYDPRVGRFLSTDPVTDEASRGNRYSYAANNPYRFIDPDGRMTCSPRDHACSERVRRCERKFGVCYGSDLQSVISFVDRYVTGGFGRRVDEAIHSRDFIGAAVYTLAGAGVGLVDALGGVGGLAAKGARETVRVGTLIATHGRVMSNKELSGLIKSVRSEGIREPLTVTEHQGKLYILDGHHRALAAPRAGVAEVPINRVELPFGAYKTPADLTFTPGSF